MRRFVSVLILGLIAAGSGRADGALDGNWKLVTITAAAESTVVILKVETKDGKPAAAVVFSPAEIETKVNNLVVTDTGVNISVRQVRTIQGRTITSDMEFIGLRGKDDKVILGSTATGAADERIRTRAKLVATDKASLEANERTVRTPLPEPMQKAQQLGLRSATLQRQAQGEMDADKKKELTEQAQAARKEADEQVPTLYREVAFKTADSPAVLDAALNLIRLGRKAKLTEDEAGKLVAVVRQQSEPYGPRFGALELVQAAEGLIAEKGLEAAALAAAEPAAKALTDAFPAAVQSRVLTAYLSALEKTGKTAEAKEIGTRLAKLEAKLDEEYLAKVPPFKPEAYAGRKGRDANQVVVMELFTGAQCPPCVAADVAFDALNTSYPPAELVLIEYHMHIPGPDPMVNLEDIARWDYYREKFPEGMRGTPSTVFNGKPEAGGGGAMANAQAKLKAYRTIIDPLLEKTNDVSITGKAVRSKDKIDIAVDVSGSDPNVELKLRIVLVEDVVRFVGGNGLRFHHHVVRAMPNGPAGVTVKGKVLYHKTAVDVAEIRTGLEKYLTTYAETRAFPQPGKPLEMKNLKAIAFLQNDKTGEIVQAVQIDVEE